MSDNEKLNKAIKLYNQGKYPETRKLLEEITTKDPAIRINVLSAFIGVLDHVSENNKLLATVNEGIEIATSVGNKGMLNYFLGKKCLFLMSDLSMMLYRQGNLMLSARVFSWIGFSLERDKKEYEAISDARKELEKEIDSTLTVVIQGAEASLDHNFRGHQFSTIGDAYSSKYLADKLAFQDGGKVKSKIANLYFVRRWDLDRYLYGQNIRKKIDESRNKCIQYSERSVEEFRLADMKSEQANTIYNLAVKFQLFNRFRRAKQLLVEARIIAESISEMPLLNKITKLEASVADKNKNIRYYVSEAGLDLP
jgi:hypothetical protein